MNISCEMMRSPPRYKSPPQLNWCKRCLLLLFYVSDGEERAGRPSFTLTPEKQGAASFHGRGHPAGAAGPAAGQGRWGDTGVAGRDGRSSIDGRGGQGEALYLHLPARALPARISILSPLFPQQSGDHRGLWAAVSAPSGPAQLKATPRLSLSLVSGWKRNRSGFSRHSGAGGSLAGPCRGTRG